MKKSLFIIFPLLVTLFTSLAEAQIPNQTLQYFSVLTQGNLIDNNPYLIKGLIGVHGSLTGTYSKADSVLSSSSTELADALNELSDLETYLNI
jgi:hypothetical protein